MKQIELLFHLSHWYLLPVSSGPPESWSKTWLCFTVKVTQRKPSECQSTTYRTE